MNLEELCSYIKELFEEQKATQRAIALNQRKLSQLEKKVDRILNQHDKRYVEVGYRA
jgi:23S rRNA U2552 (ribose-2'-O)-methylase RlmE/FtsJ